jgi:hypothetical protein
VSVELRGNGNASAFQYAVDGLKELGGVLPETVRSDYTQRAASFVHKSEMGFDHLAAEFAALRPGWTLKLVPQVQ